MLLTVKSIRIKRMNVEIIFERGVRRGARGVCKGKGRLQGASGVRKGVGHCFWGIRRGAGACGIVFWGVRRDKQRSQGARTACMIVFAADVRFFCKFEFYVHIHYYF